MGNSFGTLTLTSKPYRDLGCMLGANSTGDPREADERGEHDWPGVRCGAGKRGRLRSGRARSRMGIGATSAFSCYATDNRLVVVVAVVVSSSSLSSSSSSLCRVVSCHVMSCRVTLRPAVSRRVSPSGSRRLPDFVPSWLRLRTIVVPSSSNRRLRRRRRFLIVMSLPLSSSSSSRRLLVVVSSSCPRHRSRPRLLVG